MTNAWIVRYVSALALLCTCCSYVRAQQVEADPDSYSFYPNSIMSIGVGFSPNELTRPKARCIEGTPSPLEPGAISTQFSAVLVTNSEQLKNALSLDTKIDASYLVFSGSGQFTFKSDGLFESDSITVVITAATEFGRISYKSRPTLDPDAKALLSDGAKFAKTCGTRYVAIERRGASVSAIITLASVHKEDKNTIIADMSASGGFGPLSGKASADFQDELSRASTSGRASIQVVSTGGAGFGGLGDVISSLAASPKSIDPIQKALGDYIKVFTADNAVPIGFNIGSMTDFGWDPNSVDLWNLQKERRLREIVNKYRDVESRLESAQGILANTDPRAFLISQEQSDRIKTTVPVYENYLDALAAAHKTCKDDTTLKTCNLPSLAMPVDDVIPPMPKTPEVGYVVEVDGKPLDFITSRAIYFTSHNALIDRVRVYQQSAKAARVLFTIKGSYLATSRIIFRPLGGDANSHSVAVDLLPIKPTGAEYCVECLGTGTGLFAGGAPANGNAVLFDRILDFQNHIQPEGEGTFYIEVQDKLGRKFTVAVLKAKWKISQFSTVQTIEYIEY